MKASNTLLEELAGIVKPPSDGTFNYVLAFQVTKKAHTTHVGSLTLMRSIGPVPGDKKIDSELSLGKYGEGEAPNLTSIFLRYCLTAIAFVVVAALLYVWGEEKGFMAWLLGVVTNVEEFVKGLYR